MEAYAEALTLPLFTGFMQWEIENVAVFSVEQEVNFRSVRCSLLVRCWHSLPQSTNRYFARVIDKVRMALSVVQCLHYRPYQFE